MPIGESADLNNVKIRDCIIPNGEIRIVALHLGPGENGLVTIYEPEDKDIKELKENVGVDLESLKVVPITLRKHLLCKHFKAS